MNRDTPWTFAFAPELFRASVYEPNCLYPASLERHDVTIMTPERTAVIEGMMSALYAEYIENRRPTLILVGGEFYCTLVRYNLQEQIDSVPIRLDRKLGEREVRVLCEPREEFNLYLKSRAGR